MTTPTTSATRFSQVLRDATATDHRDAAGAGFVHGLLSGSLPVEAYADLAAQQWYIYAELEKASDAHRFDPVAGAFVHDELTRRTTIEGDLATVVGTRWRSAIRPLPATTAYVDRLRSVAATSAVGFVAHHYTRYLGDLSGGQYIGKAIDRNYGFEGGPGARFYVFDQIDDADAFKERYRAALDQAPWSPADHAAVIDEVKVAYTCNQAVIAELAEVHLPAEHT
jgi:heme oxygenase